MRDRRLTLNLTSEEARAVQVAADAAGGGLSTWSRSVLVEAAKGYQQAADFQAALDGLKVDLSELVIASEGRSRERLQRLADWLQTNWRPS